MGSYYENGNRSGRKLLGSSETISTGISYILLEDVEITLTKLSGQDIAVSKALGDDQYVYVKSPAHLGYVNKTSMNCTVALSMRNITNEFSEVTPVIVIDKYTSANTAEHYFFIGYSDIEDIPETLLDILHLDTKLTAVKSYRSDLGTIQGWMRSTKNGRHNRPFAGLLCSDDTTHRGTSMGQGMIPISYSYEHGRKVYKACVLGQIMTMNDSWRTLCDTISHMEPDEVIIVYISSEGGDTQTASAFISAVTLCRGTVVTIAVGSCASAGPVIWSVGDIRLMTDNASMMVHSMIVSDPSSKPTSHIVDMGEFVKLSTEKFLNTTVGKVGLATDEEISAIINGAREYYHSVQTVHERTGAPIVSSDRDIWVEIEKKRK